MGRRIDWIDQVKGLAIFFVAYAHNFPFYEKYFYCFLLPLFLMIAAYFHPKKITKDILFKRVKGLMIPYFIWSLLLFVFWAVAGRNYGNSATQNLSIVKNFIGVFYAQGGEDYMSWGIPMWYLPVITLTFLLFSLIQLLENKIFQIITLCCIVAIGFIIPRLIDYHLPWSLDVAFVALSFYSIGFYFFKYINRVNVKTSILLIALCGAGHIFAYRFNVKTDMYRSQYGNPLFFLFNGFTGALFYFLLIKTFPYFKFLSFLGKNTIIILATHSRALTVIKFVIMITTGVVVFNFSELEKFILVIIQMIILIYLRLY